MAKFSVAMGLGSNLGDRLCYLERAVRRLSDRVLTDVRVSPVVETAAWLKSDSPSEWNQPFLNLVIEGQPRTSLEEALALCQTFELELGRKPHATWSPREIDIDILVWGEERREGGGLSIPHHGVGRRPFVLDPWMALNPDRQLSLMNESASVLTWRRRLPDAAPLLMGILNITPDSFSEQGAHFSDRALEAYFAGIKDTPPSILDLGGQSTRPGAALVGEVEEWRRLERALEKVKDLHRQQLRPWLSIDTFRGELARRAIEWGVEMINDVSGFDDPLMIELAASSSAQFVFMHHLGVPVVSGRTLQVDCDPVHEVIRWAEEKLELLTRQGVALDRLIFDPGIGFGKTPAQSMELIRRAAEFKKLPVRVLYGHSRKSYQRSYPKQYPHLDPEQIDAFTVQQSLELAERGVEFLRVHNLPLHREAMLQFESREGRL